MTRAKISAVAFGIWIPSGARAVIHRRRSAG